MKDDIVYVQQILESIAKIESFASGLDRERFIVDAKTQSAVIMQLTLIGEVAKKVSPKTKESVNLPWKDIAGFRDQAIHNYFEIDLDVVWDTVITDIPLLKKELQKIKLKT